MISKLFLWAVAAVFAIPFLYSIVAVEHTASATLPLRLILLGLFPLVSTLALTVSVRGSQKTRVNLALAICLSVFALYLGEMVLPVVIRARAWATVVAARDEPMDRRDKVEVMLDARARGIEAVTSIEPKGLLELQPDGSYRSRLADNGSELLPVSGVANQHTVLCNEGGSWVTYESDRFGMNNPDSVWSFGRLDIATVGDSFTNGWCVRGEHHYRQLIRDEFPRTVNVAQSGHGPLLILASIAEYLVEWEPQSVLWFHYEGNDFEDLAVEGSAPLLRG